MSQQNTQQLNPQIIIKGNEISQLNELLDEFPHGVAKKIIAFINSTQQSRNAELVAAEIKEQQVANIKELEELRAYKSLNEACKNMEKEPVKAEKTILSKGLLCKPAGQEAYDGAKVNPSKLDDLSKK